VAERGLVVSKPDDLGVSGLEVRNQSIRAVVGRFRQTRILPPPFYLWAMLRLRTRLNGFVEPCLPSPAECPPSGPNWLHEIKHDGYRLMARRDPAGIRLLTRNGHDWASRFPLIVQAVNYLRVKSCLIDGEAVCCDDGGLPVFQKLRLRRQDRHVFLYAFDLLELNRKDLRREPLEHRKSELARLLRSAKPGLQLNEHIAEPGDIVFRHARALGFEGVVSKRLGSRYVSGRSRDWIKSKNPNAPAVKREAEEDWGK
jgi:bifunctional non-homologous end joining protein LigD